jgi:hypothetical protein
VLRCAGEETKAADGDGDGGDGDGDSKAADGDSKTAEKPEVPPGRPKLTAAAICLDTLGQNRAFTPSQIECVSAWAKRLASAMNRSEQALYIVKYKKHVADLAEAAARAEADAKAAEEAAKAAGERSDPTPTPRFFIASSSSSCSCSFSLSLFLFLLLFLVLVVVDSGDRLSLLCWRSLPRLLLLIGDNALLLLSRSFYSTRVCCHVLLACS